MIQRIQSLVALLFASNLMGQTFSIDNQSLVIENIPFIKIEKSSTDKVIIVVDSSVYSQKNVKKFSYLLNTNQEDAFLKGTSKKKLDLLDKKNWFIIRIPDGFKRVSISNFEQVEGASFIIKEFSIRGRTKAKAKLTSIKAEFFESYTNANVVLDIRDCHFNDVHILTDKEFGK